MTYGYVIAWGTIWPEGLYTVYQYITPDQQALLVMFTDKVG